MKKEHFGIIAMIVVIVSVFIGCSNAAAGYGVATEHGVKENINPSRNIVAYDGVQVDDGLKFANSINLDDEYYLYYFKLGTIKQCPIYTTAWMQYSFDSEEIELKLSKLTESQITNSFMQASQTIETHSYTKDTSIKFNPSVTFNFKVFGVKLGDAKVSAFETSKDEHWTNSWGETTTTSNYLVEDYLESFKTEISRKIVFKEAKVFKKGYYYRLAYYEPLEAYGVLIYDVKKAEYSVSYQEMMSKTDKISIWEESENATSENKEGKHLAFDVNKAIDYAEKHKPELNQDGNATAGKLKEKPYKVRTTVYTVTDAGRKYQIVDRVPFSNDYNAKELLAIGYTKLKVTVTLDVREINDGYQYVFLYSDDKCNTDAIERFNAESGQVIEINDSIDPSLLCIYKFQHGLDKDTSWWPHTFTITIPMSRITDDLYIRYDASGKYDDDWENRNVVVTLEPVK